MLTLATVGLCRLWDWLAQQRARLSLRVPCPSGGTSPPRWVLASQLAQPAEVTITAVAFHNVPSGKWPENERARLPQAIE